MPKQRKNDELKNNRMANKIIVFPIHEWFFTEEPNCRIKTNEPQ